MEKRGRRGEMEKGRRGFEMTKFKIQIPNKSQ